jgi:hypothetical protein
VVRWGSLQKSSAQQRQHATSAQHRQHNRSECTCRISKAKSTLWTLTVARAKHTYGTRKQTAAQVVQARHNMTCMYQSGYWQGTSFCMQVISGGIASQLRHPQAATDCGDCTQTQYHSTCSILTLPTVG